MSSIPPNIVGPIAQSVAQQQSTSRALKAEEEHRTGAAETDTKRRTEAADAIDETDNDTRVHADAEGSGGQGRAHAEPQAQENEDTPSQDQDVHRDDQGHPHVDLQA